MLGAYIILITVNVFLMHCHLYHKYCPSLSLVKFFDLKSVLSDMSMATLVFLLAAVSEGSSFIPSVEAYICLWS